MNNVYEIDLAEDVKYKYNTDLSYGVLVTIGEDDIKYNLDKCEIDFRLANYPHNTSIAMRGDCAIATMREPQKLQVLIFRDSDIEPIRLDERYKVIYDICKASKDLLDRTKPNMTLKDLLTKLK